MTKRKGSRSAKVLGRNLRVVSADDISAHLTNAITKTVTTIYPYRQEALGLLLLLLALIVFFNMAGLASGFITNGVGNLVRSLFGWGTIPMMLALGTLSVYLLRGALQEAPQPISLEVVIGTELVLICGLAVIHLIAGGDSLALARAQGGGGFVGWSLGILLQDLVGRWFAAFVYLILSLAGLGLIFRLKLDEAQTWTGSLGQAQQAYQTPGDAAAKPFRTASRSKKETKPKAPQSKPSMSADEAVLLAVTNRGRLKLPPLDLLAPPAETANQNANARYQAQIIEETLGGFGVPAEVVEVNVGPTVTQFGVKPGTISRTKADGSTVEQRIRVNKISSLNNDLALALAAAPIRIETPVPGRPIVGIEVPNGSASLVSLRGVMESDIYRRTKGNLVVGLGNGTAGQAKILDLTALPHLLIAGATGSGKSACINSMIISLLMTCTPEQLRFLMIDPKMVELTNFNGIPHLIAPVVTDFDQVAGALAWVTREMERRYKAFAATGSRSIGGYNHKAPANERLPFLVVIIDELADLMMLAADEVERYVCRIAQMARATGIHMVIATQRPSVDVVTGLIKANFPARIAFAVTSQIDSRVILDTPGAEKLLGKGDMLYMAPDSPQLIRLQGCWVSDPEINNVVDYWKRASVVAESAKIVDEPEPEEAGLPWDDLVKEASQDDLFKEAVKLIVKSGRASTTLLQRRLGIGYPRASRLMDQLEEEGIIGPADGTSAREVLWEAGSMEEEDE